VAAFLAGRGPITRYWHMKYRTLRGFFSYTVTRGYLFTSPLPATVPKPPARFVPHIYSREELRRLLDGTASYQKHKTRIVMEPHTFRAILLLLYGAALRVSEALSLNLADVDLEEAVIVIRDTKFYKTRLVPLGSDINDVMTKYAKQRKRDGHSQYNNAPFFVTRLGARKASFSILLLEALAAGLRVAALPGEGTSRAGEHWSLAEMATSDTADAYADALQRALAPSTVESVARARAMARRHAWSVMVPRIRRVYDEALSPNAR
jgi:integrase